MTTQNDRNARMADSLIDRRNTLACLAGQIDAMAAPDPRPFDYCNFYSDEACTLSDDLAVQCHANIDYCPLAGPDGELAQLRRCAYGPPLFPDDTLIGPEPKVPYRLPKAAK